MNLHTLASGQIAAVNPMQTVRVQVANGYTTAEDTTRTPTYRPPVARVAQVQPLSTGDIQHMEGLNIQGEKKALYLWGTIDGLVRPDRKGGDLVTFADGSVWIVVMVLEEYPGWCKAAITRQNQGGC